MFKAVSIVELTDYLLSLDDNRSDELSNIMTKYDSDKGAGLSDDFINLNKYPPNGVCHNYTFFYSKLFDNYRNEPIKIFEMGVGVPSCMASWAGSLKGWKEYFPNSIIFSADFDKNYLYCDERITSYYVDQENPESITNMWLNMTCTFDLIVDDGPHTHSSNILFYENSIHKLNTNGIYIIEDVNLDFINDLYIEIDTFNKRHNINTNMVKLIIPYPKKFTHTSQRLLNMNNLIIIKKLE